MNRPPWPPSTCVSLLLLFASACTGGTSGSGGGTSGDGSPDDSDASPPRGAKALIYRVGSSVNLGNGDLQEGLQAAGAEVGDGAWPASLDEHRIVFLLDVGPLSDSETAKLRTFVDEGGGLVISAEPSSNGRLPANLLLERLDSDLRIEEAEMLFGCNSVEAIGSDPLNSGAAQVAFSLGYSIQGGTGLYGSGDAVGIARSGTIVVAGDSDTFLDGGCLGCCGRGEGDLTFWQNLYAELAD